MSSYKLQFILSIFILIILGFVCSSNKQEKPEVVKEKEKKDIETSSSITKESNDSSENQGTYVENGNKTNSDETNKPTIESKPDVFYIGDKVKLGDFVLVVKSVSVCNSSNEFIRPDPGKKFISVDITVENVGSEPRVYNLLFFQLQDDQDFTYTPSIFPCDEPGFNSGILQKDQRTRGYLTFEIPIRNNSYQLIYTPDWWHRGQILVNLSKKKDSKIEDSESENEQLAVIDDPDGYTNIRNGPGMDFDIIGKVLLDEKFYVKPNPDKQWWHVKTQAGINGFMHKSKIKLLSKK